MPATISSAASGTVINTATVVGSVRHDRSDTRQQQRGRHRQRDAGPDTDRGSVGDQDERRDARVRWNNDNLYRRRQQRGPRRGERRDRHRPGRSRADEDDASCARPQGARPVRQARRSPRWKPDSPFPGCRSAAASRSRSAATVTAAGGSVTNTATVTAPAGVNDPTPANNSASDTDSAGTTVDLSLTMTNGTNSVTAAGSTTYTIVVTNAGTIAAEGAAVTVAVTAGLQRTSLTCAASGGAVCPSNPDRRPVRDRSVAADAAAGRHRDVHARRHRDGCERHREHHRDRDAARRIHGHEYREQFRDRHRFGHRRTDRRPTSPSPRATA